MSFCPSQTHLHFSNEPLIIQDTHPAFFKWAAVTPHSRSGGRIWTCDLRVMSPTSFRTALPRVIKVHHLLRCLAILAPIKQAVKNFFNFFWCRVTPPSVLPFLPVWSFRPSPAGALKAPLDNTAINPLLFLIERKSTTRFGTRYPLYRTIRKYNYSFFAKVVAWDASGIPTVICSKWGPGELIQITDYNPFGGNTYGHPKRYYKQTNWLNGRQRNEC